MTSVVKYSTESERTSTGLAEATQETENHQNSEKSDQEQESGKAFLKRILLVACLGYVPTVAFTIVIYFVEGSHEDSEIRTYEETKISAMEAPLKLDFDLLNETEIQVWMKINSLRVNLDVEFYLQKMGVNF